MIVIACPGQGSQTPGFLNEWLELPGSHEFLGTASEHAQIDLVLHGTQSDADTIRNTAIAQPLIVAASLLAWHHLADRVSLQHAALAGHSVGEFAAAAAAGVLTTNEALSLVGVRGRAMAAAASEHETGMSAVLGGIEETVLDAIASHGLTAANRNGAGQIVAAGALQALGALAAEPPRGARVIPLQVAGAFHTSYMASAVPVLEAATQKLTPRPPTHTLWTNSDGSIISDGNRYVSLLVSQIAQPVRWDACMEGFQSAGITGLIELAPAGALSGIAKRALKGTPTVAVKTPSDLDAAVELLTSTAA